MFVQLTDEEADIKQGLIRVYTGQIIVLYALNLHCAICQLDHNKTGRKKKRVLIICSQLANGSSGI